MLQGCQILRIERQRPAVGGIHSGAVPAQTLEIGKEARGRREPGRSRPGRTRWSFSLHVLQKTLEVSCSFRHESFAQKGAGGPGRVCDDSG